MRFEKYRKEFEEDCKQILENDFFGEIDLRMLYEMIRENKPKQIVEIGAGYSSYCMWKAMKRYQDPNIISIDPVEKRIVPINQQFHKRWQEMDYEKIVDGLKENDVLFIDGEHTEKEFHEYQEKLFPLLEPGVIVHFHDVCDNPFDRHYDPENGEVHALLKFLKNNPGFFEIMIHGNKEMQWSYSLWVRRNK